MLDSQLNLNFNDSTLREEKGSSQETLQTELQNFREFGKKTIVENFPDPDIDLPVYVNEFWTSKQRAAHSIHEISYRACFKPQLPRFFIERLTRRGDSVYDPFTGRGTTLVEAALLGRIPIGCDINPLSEILTKPRIDPPTLPEIAQRLQKIDFNRKTDLREDLLVFYHPKTLRAITNLKDYLLRRAKESKLDKVDAWIRMVATNRLTGHSSGFFSVYTLPPNQAVSIKSQQQINEKRQQIPEEKNVAQIILKKSRSLFRNLDVEKSDLLQAVAKDALFITGSCHSTPQIADNSIKLVVTSPPFLDIVDYKTDNWLRCWFNGIEASEVNIWQLRKPLDWQARMQQVFKELRRILVPGGHIAFEVGEVKGGKLALESLVVPAAKEANLKPVLILINDQKFTKTSNCWGVDNLKKGTNTNRIILLKKSEDCG